MSFWVGMAIFISIGAVQAQATYLANVSFSSKNPQGWSIQPTFSQTSPSWQTDTTVCVSSKYAMHGYVPYGTSGDTSELITPYYDCTNYGYVMLRFNQICKVWPSDICEIQYQEDVLGSAYGWKTIPYDAYKGGDPTYRANLCFSHTSYTTWADYDSLAQPNNGWWKQETFDMSDYAGYSKVRFRFIIRKGSNIGSFIAAGWFIDDFQVIASKNELKPPVVEFLSNLNDTIYSTGPFTIKAKVATRTAAKIVNPYLAYSITYEGKTKKDSVRMKAVEGDSIWEANIPQQYYGSQISYSIFGRDANGNNARANGNFVNKRLKAGEMSGYTYYMPDDTTGGSSNNLAIVYHVGYASSLSRSLYLASEINPNNLPMVFSKLAWYNRSYTTVVTRNIKIWMLATNDQTTPTSFIDPTTSGATLVYDGITVSTTQWNEVNFKKPFSLPAGKNLYIFYEGYGGTTSTSSIYWAGHSQSNRCVYNYNGGWSASTMVPLIRLSLGGGSNYDSNSVALASIDNPAEGTIAGKQPVKVTIQNMGDKWLDSCQVNWTVNGVLQTPKIWKGHLYTDFYDTVTIGSYIQKRMDYDTITVWVSSPNNKVDSVLDDDTLTVIAFGCDSAFNGTYTVGTGGKYDFTTLSEAFSLMDKCGIGGDVTLKLASGIYTEKLAFSNFNTNGKYRITIGSIAGKADSVIYRPATGPVVSLNNCKGITFKNITFDAKKAKPNAVHLGTGLTDIEFSHCTIIGLDTAVSSNSFSTIYRPSGAPIRDIRFIGNEILGGSYAIYFYGSGTASRNSNILFDSNHIAGYYSYATYMYYNNSLTVKHNRFDGARSGNDYDYGFLSYYTDSGLFEGNRVHTYNRNSYQYGMRIYYIDSNTIISNNEITLYNENTTSYGMYVYYASGTKVFNNSILEYGKCTTKYGFYIYSASAAYHAEIKNNISVCHGTGTCYPIYFTSTTAASIFDVDYNCWWSQKNVGYVGAAKTTLAAFQSSIPSAVHDIYMRPSFKDSTVSLMPKNFIGINCPNQTDVPYDINGVQRVGQGYMGCYTDASAFVKDNAILVELTGIPEVAAIGDTICPYAVLQNGGSNTLTSATIALEIDNVAQGKNRMWNGKLAIGEMDTIPLGCYVVKNTGYLNFKAFLTGSQTDTITRDDTASYNIFICSKKYAGDYTIGPNGDFKSLNDALKQIGLCGLGSDVNLKYISGTYSENIDIFGLNFSQYHLTINSLAGNADSVILRPKSGPVVTLNDASGLIFKNITFDAQKLRTTNIRLETGLNDIEFSHCKILGSDTAVSNNNFSNIYRASGAPISNIRFIGNEILGGSYGIYFYGSGTASRNSNIVFDSNHIADYYSYATYMYYNNSLRVTHNFFEGARSGNSYDYGFLSYYNDSSLFDANRFRTYNRNNYQYGLRVYYPDSTTTISNNEIILYNDNTTSYGLYPYDTRGTKIVNNSVLLYGKAGTQYGIYTYMYQNGSTIYWGEIKNNISVCHGTSTVYPIYSSSATNVAGFDVDYNCWWSPKNVGYIGAAKATLSAFQSTVTTAVHDMFLRPDFQDSTQSLKLLTTVGYDCPKITGTDFDLIGNQRDSITTIGAYTKLSVKTNAALLSIVDFPETTDANTSVTPGVLLMNTGADTITEVTLRVLVNGVSTGNDLVWKGRLGTNQYDTVRLGSLKFNTGSNKLTVYILRVGLQPDSFQEDDTVQAETFTCSQKLAGTFTVGANGYFSSIKDAIDNLMKCGMGGAVTLSLLPGTYTENITLTGIPGLSSTNTLTFTSSTGDSSSVLWNREDDATKTTVTAQAAPLVIDGASHVTVKNLTLTGMAPNTTGVYSSSHAIVIVGLSHDIEVNNCHLYVPKNFNSTVTSHNHSSLYIHDGGVHNIHVHHNLIEGGATGCYVYGSASADRVTNVTIDHNEIGYIDYSALYAYYTDSLTFSNNTATQRRSDLTPANAYMCYTYYTNANILYNRFDFIGINYGFYIGYFGNISKGFYSIANNEVRGILTSATGYGVYMTGGSADSVHVDFLHNSIAYDATGTTAYGFYAASSYINRAIVKNNIIHMRSTEATTVYPIYISSTSYLTGFDINYNCFYSEHATKYVGYAGGAKSTISAWQQTVTTDNGSVFMAPSYVNIGKSMEIYDNTGLTCPTIGTCMTDINGVMRNRSCNMGAYELRPLKLDLSLEEVQPNLTATVSGSIPLTVSIRNIGSDTVKSMEVNYILNGIVGTAYVWNGNLAYRDTANVTVGKIQLKRGRNTLTVFCYNPNKGNDMRPANDTLTFEIIGCDKALSGTYTVGTPNSDFATLDEALEAAKYCGLSGPTVFALASGSYSYAVLTDYTSGSSTNTLTIRSASRNSSDVTISGGRAFRLQKVAHLRLENLTLKGTTIALDMKGDIEDVLVSHCNIYGPEGTTSSANRAVSFEGVSGSGRILKDVRFIGNDIRGGYYNFYLYYFGSNSTHMRNASVTIDSNTLSGAYYYGIYTGSYGQFESISHNEIKNGSNAGIFYAIYMNSYQNVPLIEGNRIRLTNSNTSYGIYMSSYNNYSSYGGSPGLIANNEIILTGNGSKYGIYRGGTYTRYNVVNNSVYVKGTSTCYAMYGTTCYSGYPMNVMNNLLVNDYTTGYALYRSDTTTLQAYGIRDYNNYYSRSGNLTYLRQTAQTSLKAIQSLLSNQDQNSMNIQPVWNNAGPADLELKNSKKLLCPIAYNVDRNILGELRTGTTTVGCYGLVPDSTDVALISFHGTEAITSIGTHPLYVIIANNGIMPLDSATINFSIDGTQQNPVLYKPANPLKGMQQDTVALGTFAFKNGNCTLLAYTTATGDINHANDTIQKTFKVCNKVVSGKLVIGNSAKADYSFTTIGNLVSDMLNCGVSGDVTLLVESGNYAIKDTMNLSLLGGLMGNNHLTISSLAGNRDSVSITSAGAVVLMGDNKNITIENITLIATTGNVIVINGPCENIHILNNHLKANTTGSSNTDNVIYKPSGTGLLKGFYIIGNKIEGGYYGNYLYGESTSSYSEDVVIDSNEIFNQYYYANYFYYTTFKSISHNNIYSRSTNTTSNWYGMRLYYCNAKEVCGNFINATKSTSIISPYGMYLYYINYNLTTDQALFANNVIRANTTGTFSGTYMYYSRIKYMHNSVLMSGTGQGRCLYYSTTSSYPMTIMGNMFVTDPNQYPIYAGSTTSGIAKLDYNNYYGGGTYVGYHGSARNSLSSWQSATGEDANSVSEPVTYINPNIDQKLKSYSKFFMPLIADVTCDYEGLTREKITAMGAYTPVFQQLDAALTDFAKTDLSNPAKAHIEVTLANYGKDTLTTAVIEWSVNKVQQTAVKWSGKLPQFGTTTVVLGSTALTAGKMSNITAWVTDPNGKKDMEPINDTVSIDEFICNGQLAGSYTVGGTTPDFAILDDAILALTSCGVSAPVTLKMRSGSFKGISISGSVPGASSTNTITVMPDGNAKVVINEPNGTSLILSNTAHWHFRNITFGNTTDGIIGVELQGNIKDVSFRHCNIYASTSTTNSTYRAVNYPNSSGANTYPVELMFVGNNIQGGYYGMYLYYTAGSTSNMQASSITVDSNTIANAYYYGFYSYYYSHYKSISYNKISNRKGSSSYFYGLYNYEYSNIEHIEGNRILVQNTSGSYGIYLSYDKNQSSYGGKPGVLKNNEVILLGSGSSTIYGIYMYNPNQNWEVVNNSVLARGGSSTVYGLYAYNTSTAYKLTIKNNHFVTYGTSTNYPIYLYTYYTSSYVNLDYNNYYSLSGTYIGYAGSAISSLSNWQTTTGMDTHSVSTRPQFIDSTIDLQLMDYSSFVCPMASSVPVDINGDKRTSFTTMGCYGVELYEEVNLQVENFVTPEPIADVVCYADYTTVSVAIKNAGLKKADFTKSPLKVSLDITGAISYHFDTTYTTGGLIFQEADTLVLTTVPTIASGVYHMKITLNDTADKVMEDDTISLVYNASRVELPYDIDFTTVPNEFVNATMAGETEWKVVKGSGSNPAIAPAFGTGRLEFAGASDPGAYAHAIFNAVNIKGCVNPTLSFWFAHSADCTNNDVLTVLVTTDGGANYTELKSILVADTATAWKQYDIDLSAFTQSSCLSVVFRAMSFGGANQSIDRIRITADQDAAISLLPIDISNRTACDNTPVEIKAVITNLSRLNIDMVNDTLTLNVTGAVSYSNKVVYNNRLGSFATDTVTLGQISLDANGAYYFNACMQPFDDKTANDTTSDSSLFIMQDIALDSVIGIDNQMFKMTGESVNVTAIAVNNGNIPVDKVILHMGIDGNEVVADTVAQRLYPGDTLVHPMSRAFVVPAVSKDQPYYFFELRTELSCDADNTNDVISIVGQVNIPDSIDIQVLEIVTTEQALGKTKLSPTVRVANIGNMEADNIIIHVMVINDSNRVVDSISENISHMAINETKNHDFTMTYKVPDYTGKYTLRAYVEAFDGDTIQSNDTIAKQFRCYRDSVGIRDAEQLDWSLGQNIPNPASSVTAIPFTLPQAGSVRISVMAANGQVIFRQETEAEAGSNRIEVDASDWAAGVYYYTMEYRGQRITRKMNITR
ncbi:MAG: hypothetical protein IJM65_01075 [Bacteroidales bacterium]|nr:hypothetical protein [Bacteroidales bacterium]